MQAAKAIEATDALADYPFRNNAVVTNLVHSGIAAADAICCFELRSHSQGDDHRGAVAHLGKVGHGGASLAKALGVLLALETRAGYGAKPLRDDDVKRAERAARSLVEAARERRAQG